MRIDAKSVASGILFILMGLAYFWMAWSKLPIGSAMDMGPGYFPIVLSGGLVVFGSSIALLGIRHRVRSLELFLLIVQSL